MACPRRRPAAAETAKAGTSFRRVQLPAVFLEEPAAQEGEGKQA